MTSDDYNQTLEAFRLHLTLEEYAENTIKHYYRDVQAMLEYTYRRQGGLNKENLIAYKGQLVRDLQPASVNRKIAAINSYLRFVEAPQLILKSITVQKENTDENELTHGEFAALVDCARVHGKTRLTMIMLTLAGTGIRIGELKYITVKAVAAGKVTVRSKGKVRTVILPKELQDLLLEHCSKLAITSGPIFTNRDGQPLSRSYVASEMKRLACQCQVAPEKVFPHNLRHYFARSFLDCGYPVTDLADHLGHNSINTTRRYLITSTATKQKQLSRLTVFRARGLGSIRGKFFW